MSSDNIYKNSPYIYHDGMRLVKDCSKKSNTSIMEIKKFVSKKLLTSEDMAIMDALYEYQILNRHVLEQLLLFGKEKKNYKRRLHKLMELGIIERFTFSYMQQDENDEVEKNTPYFYSLTSGSYNYVKRFSVKNQELFNPEIVKEKVCEILALNQFDVFFQNSYGKYLKKRIKSKDVDFEGKALTIDLAYHLQWKNIDGWHNLIFAIVPVRRYTACDWKEQLKVKVADLVKYSENTSSLIPYPLLVFIAESDEHIKEIHKLFSDFNFQGCTALFTTDLLTARFPICEYLYSCKDTNTGIILDVKKLNF
jgi:hypothetical protein